MKKWTAIGTWLLTTFFLMMAVFPSYANAEATHAVHHKVMKVSAKGSFFNIVPASTAPIVIPKTGVVSLNYTVTNNIRQSVQNLVIRPGNGVSSSLFTASSTGCTGSIGSGASCTLTVTLHGSNNQLGAATLAPQVCLLQTGPCSIPAANNRVAVTVKGLESISITPATATIQRYSTQAFVATGHYSDGTTANVTSNVTWNSSNASVASIASTGIATAAAFGSTNITASFGGVTSPASVLTVPVATLSSIAVTATPPVVRIGSTLQLTATGTYSDGSTSDITSSITTWHSSSTSIATVSASGVMTGVSAGNTAVTASLGSITSAPLTVAVPAPTLQSITITPSAPFIQINGTQQFTATGHYSDNATANITANVTWISASTGVATIAAGGVATGHSAGTSTITASLGSVTSTVGATLTVKSATITSIAVTPTSPIIRIGGTQQLTATATYSDSTTGDVTSLVAWHSAATSVATVTAAGVVQGVSAGTSAVTASLSGVTSPNDVVTVPAPTLQSIAITPASPSIQIHGQQQFTAIGTYSDNATANITASVTWHSASASVATIVTGGVATGVSAGTSVITASLGSVTSTVGATLAVKAATITSIAVTPTSPIVRIGGTQQLTATATYSDSTTGDVTDLVAWHSASTGVATITSAGVVQGVSAGTSVVTASLSGVTSPNVTVTVPTPTLTSIAVTPTASSIQIHGQQQFTAIGTYSDNATANITTSVIWASSSNAVATIASGGVATGISAGAAAITATLGSVTSPASTLNVKNATLTSIAITPSSTLIQIGSTQQFTATGTYSDSTTGDITSTVAWVSAAPSVATIASSGGLAKAVATGSASITAVLSGVTSAPATVTVPTPTLEGITVTPVSAAIQIHGQQQYQATGHYSDNTTANISASVTWASSNTAVALISSSPITYGLATGMSAGDSVITATLNGVTSANDVDLTVKAATLTSIAITPVSPTLHAGEGQQFKATGSYSDGSTGDITTSVSWTSSNTSVATIVANGSTGGFAQTLTSGTSNIQATLSGVNSPIDTLTVSAAALQAIRVVPSATPETPRLSPGQTLQFIAIGDYSDGSSKDLTGKVTWGSVGSSNIATINANGLAQAKGLGQVGITAQLGSVSDGSQLAVANNPGTVTSIEPSLSLTSNTPGVSNGSGVGVLTLTAQNSGAIHVITPQNGGITASGCIGVGPNTCQIHFTSSDVTQDTSSGESIVIYGDNSNFVNVPLSPLGLMPMSPPFNSNYSLLLVNDCPTPQIVAVVNNSTREIKDIGVYTQRIASPNIISNYCSKAVLAPNQSCMIAVNGLNVSPNGTGLIGLNAVNYNGSSLQAGVYTSGEGVNPNLPSVGDPVEGDTVFYADPGFSAENGTATRCNLVKMVANGSGFSQNIPWAASTFYQSHVVPFQGAGPNGANELYFGQRNAISTISAEQSQGSLVTNYASGFCSTYSETSGAKTLVNWYLPSICELGGNQRNPACQNTTNSVFSSLPGKLANGITYFSSTENNATTADALNPAVMSSPIPKNVSVGPQIYCTRAVTF